jgi:tetratricopeptide (TPR) repeat protein
MSFSGFRLFGWVAGLGLMAFFLPADEAPFAPPQEMAREDRLTFLLEWQAAREASRNALPTLAVFSFEQILPRLPADPRLQAPFYRDFTRALIAAGRFTQAQSILSLWESVAALSDEQNLWQSWIAFQNEDPVTLDQRFREIRREALPAAVKSWYDLLAGFRARARQDTTAARIAFDRGLESAPNARLAAYFEAILSQAELRLGEANENRAQRLRSAIDQTLEGERDAALIREYVHILVTLDRNDDAVEFLRSQLALTPWDTRSTRESLLHLLSEVLPEDSPMRQNVQAELILSGRARPFMQMALQSLYQEASLLENPQFFLELLNRALSNPAHPLEDELLYLRAWFSLRQGNFRSAEEDARRIQDTFPGSSVVFDAQRILAQAAWRSTPPSYRIAADLYLQLRDGVDDPEDRNRYTVWAADCFFLSSDYARAALLYQEALNRRPQSSLIPNSWIAFQWILSEIRRGEADGAQRALDQATVADLLTVADRWEIEWQIARLLLRQGQQATALGRISRLLNPEIRTGEEDVALQSRLFWLRAQLAVLSGSPEETEAALSDLQLQLEESSPLASDSDRRNLEAGRILLEAQAAFHQGRIAESQTFFETLRRDFPRSEPALLSYIEEGRLLALQDRSVEAQNLFIRLADLHPSHRLAPIAIYEAALLAEKRGLNATRREALNLLERLSNDYPDHPLFFAGRLRQGQILRQLNEFGPALALYENLLSTHPQHPQRPFARMGQVEALIALGNRDPARWDDAIDLLERLADESRLGLDFRAEVASKWAHVLHLRGERDRFRLVAWRMVNEILLQEGHRLGEGGRFWMARLLLQLAEEEETLSALTEAARLYQYFIDFNLPGQGLASARRSRLLSPL